MKKIVDKPEDEMSFQEHWAVYFKYLYRGFLGNSRRQSNLTKPRQNIAKQHAETEFELFRPIQDRLFKSDFDKHWVAMEQEIAESKKK